MIIKNCNLCSKEFKSIGNRVRKYCSKECYLRFKSNGAKVFVCEKCGKEFKGWHRNGIRKFCSTKCSSLSQIGKKVEFTKEWKDNISKAIAGIKFTDNHKRKIGLAHKGRKQIWIARRNKENHGEKSPVWKGDSVGYMGLHYWVYKHLGKARHCSKDLSHISKVYHWANISGEYKREISDWRQLCPKCNLNDGVKIHPRFKL